MKWGKLEKWLNNDKLNENKVTKWTFVCTPIFVVSLSSITSNSYHFSCWFLVEWLPFNCYQEDTYIYIRKEGKGKIYRCVLLW